MEQICNYFLEQEGEGRRWMEQTDSHFQCTDQNHFFCATVLIMGLDDF